MAAEKFWCLIVMFKNPFIRRFTRIFALLMTLAPSAYAQTPAEQLAERLAGLNGVRAGIEQRIYADGTLLEQSQGSVAVARPNLLWQLDTPFPQIIILNDKQLKIYDPDLAQLTVRDLSAASGETPASLLVQPERLLNGDYSITQVNDQGQRAFRLSPKASSAIFQLLEIVFVDNVLESLTIWDWQRQQTKITFLDVSVEPSIPASLFELSVPEGTDVIRG